MALSGEYAPGTLDWARKHAEEYEATDGAAGEMRGMRVVLLTTVGAKTGKLRKAALMRVEHDGEYAVVGSLGGAPKNPEWVHNLRKNPHVELQDGPDKHDYQARETASEERDLWWDRAVKAFPDYAGYQRKTDRVIPVFVLTRLPA